MDSLFYDLSLKSHVETQLLSIYISNSIFAFSCTSFQLYRLYFHVGTFGASCGCDGIRWYAKSHAAPGRFQPRRRIHRCVNHHVTLCRRVTCPPIEQGDQCHRQSQPLQRANSWSILDGAKLRMLPTGVLLAFADVSAVFDYKKDLVSSCLILPGTCL